jgi:hypothetical protein
MSIKYRKTVSQAFKSLSSVQISVGSSTGIDLPKRPIGPTHYLGFKCISMMLICCHRVEIYWACRSGTIYGIISIIIRFNTRITLTLG